MRSKYVFPLIVTLSVFGFAGLAAQTAHSEGRIIQAAIKQLPPFDQVDVDKDGTISKDEAHQAGILDDKSFKAADRDGDDRLSQAEYRDASKRMGANQHPGA